MPKQSTEVFLIWVAEGAYDEGEVKAVAASESIAQEWCNEHRKLARSDPIQWERSRSVTQELWGRSDHYKMDLGRRELNTAVLYTIERLPYHGEEGK